MKLNVKKVGFKKKKSQKSILSDFFDSNYYLQEYEDIRINDLDPLDHYILFGWKEGRNPAPWFCNDSYLEDNPDVAQADVNPLLHYALHGKKEGRIVRVVNKASDSANNTLGLSESDIKLMLENFDAEYYLRNYADIKDNHIDPFEHFVYFGFKENRNPAAWFDYKKYVEKFYDLIGDGNAFLYHLKYGDQNGCEVFAAKDYTDEGYIKLPKDMNSTTVSVSGLRPIDIEDTLQPSNSYSPDCLDIHWVIPDFDTGGGGHMTIFRFIRWLEIFGHKCTVWILDPIINKNENEAYEKIVKYFQTIRAKVNFIGEESFPQAGDIVIATSWQTVSVVEKLNSFKEKFYFVQDYEPYFYPRGTESLSAEATYRKGLSCLCASPWLQKLMEDNYNAWARSFMLAYDKNEYKNIPEVRCKLNKKLKIAVYSRIFTARRAVELALAGLEFLAKQQYTFEVHFFGGEVPFEAAPYDCVVHGVLNSSELAKLYNSCDIGICFSATNYSLVPQEMMACGLPIIELDVESTRAIFPEGVVEFAKPSAEGIKDSIAKLIRSPDLRERQAKAALNWVQQFEWENSVKNVEKALLDKLADRWESLSSKKERKVKASVVIPVYNGGDLLFDVLDKVKKQRAPWDFEIIVIDSESNDGTAELLSKYSGIKYFPILKEQFGHGKTRNLGVELSEGEYIAFLTQDAIPLNEFWLYNLVVLLQHYDKAAGVFGAHIAHDSANFFITKEISDHFRGFLNYPLCFSKDSDVDNYKNNLQWRQALHFYSDNSSCLKRSVWKEIPYRDVKYGEDQLWAYDVTEAGYAKVFSPDSVIKHSHDYSPEETFERSTIDGDYFNFFWGYKVVNEENINELILSMVRNVESIGKANFISQEEINKRKEVIEMRIKGLLKGQNKEDSLFSKTNLEKSKY